MFLKFSFGLTVKKVENKIVCYKNSGMSTPNVLARKSGEGALPYCKTKAKSEGNN
jgi:hypothetical protein